MDKEKILKAAKGLSELEMGFLETVLEVIEDGIEVKQAYQALNNYINTDWEDLLEQIPDAEIEDYAERYLNMTLDKGADYDIDVFSDDDLLGEVAYRDLLPFETPTDIVSAMQLHEMVDLFLNMTIEKRESLIDLLKK